jgi:hypothetical protein
VEVLHSEPRRQANSGVTRFVQRLKHSMTGDHGAVSVRDIDEQVHTKIFISEIVEKEQHYIRDSPKALTESTIHIYTYLNSNQLYERCRVFESARIVWVS